MDAQAEAAASLPSYNDFEPYCEWQREKDKDTLVVKLPPGFKKDHLKVLVSNQGLVRFSGEYNTGGNNWSRFRRDIQVAKNCNVNGIQAKFSRGSLHIVMPKNINSIAAQVQAAPAVGESQEQEKPKCKDEKEEGGEKGKEEGSRNGVGGSVSRRKMGKKMALSGFAVVALVVAFGAYVAYNYQNLINFTEK